MSAKHRAKESFYEGLIHRPWGVKICAASGLKLGQVAKLTAAYQTFTE